MHACFSALFQIHNFDCIILLLILQIVRESSMKELQRKGNNLLSSPRGTTDSFPEEFLRHSMRSHIFPLDLEMGQTDRGPLLLQPNPSVVQLADRKASLELEEADSHQGDNLCAAEICSRVRPAQKLALLLPQ